MDFIRESVEELRDLADRKHNLQIAPTDEIDIDYLVETRDRLLEVTGLY